VRERRQAQCIEQIFKAEVAVPAGRRFSRTLSDLHLNARHALAVIDDRELGALRARPI
jgi:hypothetical protein